MLEPQCSPRGRCGPTPGQQDRKSGGVGLRHGMQIEMAYAGPDGSDAITDQPTRLIKRHGAEHARRTILDLDHFALPAATLARFFVCKERIKPSIPPCLTSAAKVSR